MAPYLEIPGDDLYIQKGVPLSMDVYFYNEDTELPYPLTGLVVLFTVKEINDELEDDSEALIQTSISSHSVEEGYTKLELTAEESNIPVKRYKYDFRIMDGATVLMNTDTAFCKFVNTVTKRTE
jgi:hypothetical protein